MTDRPASPQPFGIERRHHPREAVQLAVRLVLERGRVVDAVIVDRSLKGMRVRLAAATPLPRRMTVLELQALTAHEADLVWTRQGEAGLSLRCSLGLRTAAGREGEALRRLWRQAMSA